MLKKLHEELGLTKDALTNLRRQYVTLRRIKGKVRGNYYYFAELKDRPDMKLESDEGTLK